jgi:excisionase family DNA binding protein
MPRTSEILTAKQVAEYLHIHPLTVHRFAREGVIPAFKIGTDWRFQKKNLDEWIKQRINSHMETQKKPPEENKPQKDQR